MTGDAQRQIRMTDLPSRVREDIKTDIVNYATALVHCGDLMGTGTFVSHAGRFGILTALHVPNNPAHRFDFRAGAGDSLRLSVEVGLPHAFELPMEILTLYSLGQRASDEFGPDLAFIEIPPCSQLATIRAKKSFWPLDHDRESCLKTPESHEGFWAFAHYVGEMARPIGSTRGFQNVNKLPAFVSLCGLHARFEKDGYDYLECKVHDTTSSSLPDSFGGGSGGGVWAVQLSAENVNDLARVS